MDTGNPPKPFTKSIPTPRFPVVVAEHSAQIADCCVDDGTIQLNLSTPFKWTRAPIVVFRPTTPGRRYDVYANGKKAGSWRGEELENGIPLPLETVAAKPANAATQKGVESKTNDSELKRSAAEMARSKVPDRYFQLLQAGMARVEQGVTPGSVTRAVATVSVHVTGKQSLAFALEADELGRP